MIRYGIAIIVASLVIVAGAVFVRQTHAEIEERFEQQRQWLKQQKAAGKLPDHWKDVDLDAIKHSNFGMPMTQEMQIRLDATMWLEDFWFVLIPLVLAICLGSAHLWGRVFPRRAGTESTGS